MYSLCRKDTVLYDVLERKKAWFLYEPNLEFQSFRHHLFIYNFMAEFIG